MPDAGTIKATALKSNVGVMRYTRLYSGSDNESHFEDDLFAQETAYGSGMRSDITKANEIFFLRVEGKSNPNWQNAPCRQFVIVTEGCFEVTVGDGTIRRFEQGDILLAEDTYGRGHITTAVDDHPWQAVFIPLTEE